MRNFASAVQHSNSAAQLLDSTLLWRLDRNPLTLSADQRVLRDEVTEIETQRNVQQR